MDCRTFSSQHAAFIDDTLPGVEMVAMRDHISGCPRCARRDIDVRRALLLLRNLPSARVSPGFEDRVRARIRAESARAAIPRARLFAPTRLRWLAAAAVVAVVVGGFRVRTMRRDLPETDYRLPAVVATASAPGGSSSAEDPATAFVASMSTGIPMWPALMLAEEGPLRFAANELQTVGWDKERD